MIKLLAASLAGFFWTAFAFAVEAEPELEKANPITIVLFLAVFFGGCGWYAWHVIKHRNKDKAE
jgi:hypothetical protein